MGFQSQHKVLFKSKNDIKFDNIKRLIFKRFENSNLRGEVGSRKRPAVAIDANLIGYKFVNKSCGAIGSVSIVCGAFNAGGIDVILVADGPNRHHSKRATIERRATREISKIAATKKRIELTEAIQNQVDANDTIISNITKSLRKLEKDSEWCLPDNFLASMRMLERQQGTLDDTGNTAPGVTFVESLYQADPELASLALSGQVEAIVSGDSDFPLYCGPEAVSASDGSQCVDFMLAMPKIGLKNRTLLSFTVVTGQRAVAEATSGALHEFDPSQSSDIASHFSEPDKPLLDGQRSPRIRALIGIILGCDVLPRGISGIGPTECENLLEKIADYGDDDAMMLESFIQLVVSHRHAKILDPSVFCSLIDSILFEKIKGQSGYMRGTPPHELTSYNKEFANDLTTIVEGPSCLECKGTGAGPHSFLTAIGSFQCIECQVSLCPACVWHGGTPLETIEGDDTDGTSNAIADYCLECARAPSGSQYNLTEAQMRDALAKLVAGPSVPATATYAEILDLYDKWIVSSLGEIISADLDGVKYPLEPPSVLLSSEGTTTLLPLKSTDDMLHFGDCIRDKQSMPMYRVAALTKLLANLVTRKPYDSTAFVGKNANHSMLAYKKVLPEILINFAAGSRVHGAHRLCTRAVRHASDPASPDILLASSSIVLYKNNVAIRLKNEVRASMKNLLYKAETCFTASAMVATSCTCKAGCRTTNGGSMATERILCTHGLTLPVQLSLLLYGGLSEQILLHTRCRLSDPNEEACLTLETMRQYRSDIKVLMAAAGYRTHALENTTTVFEWLKIVAVGTDLSKRSPGRPNPKNFKLLRHVRYENPSQRLSKISQEGEEGGDDESTSSTSNNRPTSIQGNIKAPVVHHDRPLQTTKGVNAISLFLHGEYPSLILEDDDRRNGVIGFQLLKLRSQQEALMTTQSAATAAAEMEVLVEQLRGEVKKRPDSGVTVSKNSNVSIQRQSKKRNQRPVDNKETKNDKKRSKCCISTCNHKGTKRIPNPSKLRPNSGNRRRRAHAINTRIRRETLDRCGLGRLAEGEFRICQNHNFVGVSQWIGYKKGHYDKNLCEWVVQEEAGETIKFLAPTGVAQKSFFGSPAATRSKGLSIDRSWSRQAEVYNGFNHHTLEDIGEEGVSILVDELGQSLGEISSNKSSRVIAESPTTVVDDMILEVPEPPSPPTSSHQSHMDRGWDLTRWSTKTVQERTGFEDIQQLLSFAMIVCGGNVKALCATETQKMSFVAEWLLYAEWIYAHSRNHMKRLAEDYNISENTAQRVCLTKLLLVVRARHGWPAYATNEEDIKLRKDCWNEHFNSRRVVMHDNTNVPLQDSTDPDLHRAIRSDYYAMACAKGGVALQLCGWIRAIELLTGGIGDTEYVTLAEILKLQRDFAKWDRSSSETFLNIFDKGYRCTLEASQMGQRCLQPTFAQSDQQFSREATLISAAIAVVRSSNERAVNRMKLSWKIRDGATNARCNMTVLADIWLAWGFQVNFMYSPVL